MRYLTHRNESNAWAFGIGKIIASTTFMFAAVQLAPTSAVAAALTAPPITVDGSLVSVPALERSNKVFVPVRGVFEKLGATVNYTPPSSIVARKNGTDLVQLTVGSRAATVGGASHMLGVAPFTTQGHAMGTAAPH